MSERPDRDVLFPWEIERARKSAETGTDAEDETEVDPAATAQTDTDPDAVPDAQPVSAADEGLTDDEEPEVEAPDAEQAEAAEAEQADVEVGGVGAEAALAEAVEASAPPPAADAAGAEGADAEPDDATRASAETVASRSGESADDDERFAVLDTEFARRVAEKTNAALREKPVAQKEYYAISEVCELVGLKPHVLRYWETQFHVLNPSKNRSGNRVYQRKEIRLIMLVKHLLYEEKYTVEGAKAKLDQLRRGHELADATGVVLDRSMVEQLRADLSELATLLAPPAQG